MNDVARQAGPHDAARWSAAGTVSLMFPASRASTFASGLAAAQRADNYGEGTIGATLYHIAGFGKTREQISLALIALRALRRIKGFEVFGGGSIVQNKFEVERLLDCALTASACIDRRAHCMLVVDEVRYYRASDRDGLDTSPTISFDTREYAPRLPITKPREFPCRFMWARGFRFHHDHPSGEAAQLQAGAVRLGCDWCPFLAEHLGQRDRPEA